MNWPEPALELIPLQYVTPDGLRLTGSVIGREDQPAVVFLHGGGQTRHAWDRALHRVAAAGYRALSYDARGHGESDWAADEDYSVQAMARDLGQVLGTLNGPVALVGASMGGLTAFYALGTSQPVAVRALVLVDITLSPTRKGGQRIRSFMRSNPRGFATLDEAADAVSAYNPERERPVDPSGLEKNLRRRDDGRLHWHWDPALLSSRGDEARIEQMHDQLIKIAPCVTLPTLLIRGGDSDVVDEAGIAELRRLVPQTEILEVARAAHMVAGDRNDAFVDATLSFLARELPSR